MLVPSGRVGQESLGLLSKTKKVRVARWPSNCAKGDAVAQWKTLWHAGRGTDLERVKTICPQRFGGVIQLRMTKPISLRARPSVIAAIDARAAKLGQDRTKYILTLVERDLKEEPPPRRHKFASHDLIGAFSTGMKSGDNATIRKIARQRLNGKNC
jgi:hypothetical protein